MVEHPGERRRRRLVARHEDREHLVEELLVAHGLAVLVAGLDQHRQDVAPSGGALLAPPRDLGEQRRRKLAPVTQEAPPRREPPEVDPQERDEEKRGRRGVGEGEHPEQALPQPHELGSLVDPEDRAQDHVEGDRLHLVVNGERTADRPRVDHAVGDVPDDAAVDVDALAVERRQQELPLAEVALAIEDEDGIPAEDRTEQPCISLTAAQLLGIAHEDVLDRVRIGEDHGRRLCEGSRREAVAEQPATLLDGLVRPPDVAETLEERRAPRPGWQRGRRRRRHGDVNGRGGEGLFGEHATSFGPASRVSAGAGPAW